MGGVLTVARLLCGTRASLPKEDGGAPEGVLIGAPAAPRVEREEEDKAPSNPPTGGDFSNEDPPPYVRKKNTFNPYSHNCNVTSNYKINVCIRVKMLHMVNHI